MSEMHGGNSGEQMRDQAGQIAGGATKVGKTAKKIAGGAKKLAGKKAGKAVASGAASKVIGLKVKLIAIGVFIGLILFVGIIVEMASLISNSIIHISDPEQLSAQEDIFEYEDRDKNLEELNAKVDEAYDIVETILQEAFDLCVADLSAVAAANGWTFKTTPVRSDFQTRQTLVFLYASYSASMSNALSEESYNYYMNIEAMVDIDQKLRVLLDLPHPIHPYGNYIYGGDFERDAAGNVIVEEEVIVITPAVYDQKTGALISEAVTMTIYWVTPIVFPVDLRSVAEKAFDFSMSSPYDDTDISKKTYADIIVSQCCVLSEILFGSEWANSHEGVWGEAVVGGFIAGEIIYAGDLAVDNSSIVNAGLSQVGAGYNTYCEWWYGKRNYREAWCAIFVSWCANQMGYYDGGSRSVMPKFASCRTGISEFKKMGRYTTANTGYVPVTGDIIFFDWEQDGIVDHVGIVTACIDGVIYTVEGNSGDFPGQVKKKAYNVGSGDVVGFGHPNYP